MTSSQGLQTLTLNGLRFNANLGILPHEINQSQPIEVDV
ncbi:MAG: dihydroneopterin aldolase, partial [Burkholderiaceae bacterium]